MTVRRSAWARPAEADVARGLTGGPEGTEGRCYPARRASTALAAAALERTSASA